MDSDYDFIKPIGKHSLYKFELIEAYVTSWAEKLLNFQKCKELVFIDCMSNCGEYVFGETRVYGTPVRVAKLLSEKAKKYPQKKITLYFNDKDENKVQYLAQLLPESTDNFKIHLSYKDGNDLIRSLGRVFNDKVHCLLVYDPFKAEIDWDALKPYINNWSEVILNHMISDPIRAAKTVKRDETKRRYEMTYQCKMNELLNWRGDKKAFESKILEIIVSLRRNTRPFYVASFPFFNSKNALEYNFIHCTSNIEGFKLFKSCAWKIFKGHSSNKNTYGKDNQYQLDFEKDGSFFCVDSDCFNIHNVVEYIYKSFRNKIKVELKEIWEFLDLHPIFPSDGFKNEIKKELKEVYGVKVYKTFLQFREEE